jgi:hypothetical protein
MKTALNPNHGKYITPEGYIDLGWQRSYGECPEITNCVDLGHKRTEFDNSLHILRGTEIIYQCNICKIIYHIDMSD